MKKTIKYKSKDFNITLTGNNWITLKQFKKSADISAKMCELRKEVIDKAVAWNNDATLSSSLSMAVKKYEKFRKKHYPLTRRKNDPRN